MKNSQVFVYPVLLFVVLAFVSTALSAAPAGSSKTSKAAKVNASSLQEIEYTALVNKIGEKLVIKTTNDTTRSGELTRYTNVTLTLQLGPDSGSIELAVPRDTIRKILIEIAPADPLFPTEETPNEGKSGAKKN